jgi:hypothetical protein|tara:strand:+ start:2013 stop:2309 length:297 start_codon:yes stop_codon:yes gene_type:complete
MATKFNATTEDMAKEFSVSIATIRLWVKNGHIPRNAYLKAGNTYRFCIDLVYRALLEDPDAPLSQVPEWTKGETEEYQQDREYGGGTGIHALDTDEDI